MKSKDQDSNNSIELPEGLDLDNFLSTLKSTELADQQHIDHLIEEHQITNALQLASVLLETETLTRFQVSAIANGKTKGLTLGNYIILDKIGEGGMGVVFKAHHKRMDRVVALKVLPRESKKNKAIIDRFLREAQTAAKLTHPNIVATFDSDEAEGYHFIVMEYIKGSDLRARVKRKGPLSVSKAVDYVIQTARGLEYAHNEGIIHRDIKPANLLLDKQGTIKILDMGLARIENPQTDQSELTHHGATMGTVDYMPPEQAIDTKSVDRRADLYSLGCTLYFLLTGKPPFKGETMLVKMLGHREKSPPNLIRRRKDVSQQLNAIYQKLLAKSPDNRYQSAGELITALESILDETDSNEEPIGTVLPKIPDAKSEFDSSISFDSQARPGKMLSLDLEPDETSWLNFNVSQVPLNFKVVLIVSLALNLISGFLIVGLMTGSEEPAPRPQPPVAITPDLTEPVLAKIGSVAFDSIQIGALDASVTVNLQNAAGKLDAWIDFDGDGSWNGPGEKIFSEADVSIGDNLLEFDVPSWAIAGTTNSKFRLSTVGDTVVNGATKEFLVDIMEPELVDPNSISHGSDELSSENKSGQETLPSSQPVDAIAEIKKLGGKVSLNSSGRVFKVSLSDTQITDAGLEYLKGMTSLKHLNLDNTQVTGTGLENLKGLTSLKELLLSDTQITDAGLEDLKGLTSLITLNLDSTQITDAGLEHLKGLTSLSQLSLSQAKITDTGLEHLKGLSSLSYLRLSDTQITDAGLEYLKGMTSLKHLNLDNTQVTGTGLENLKGLTSLNDLFLSDTQITDAGLEYLKGLNHLNYLALNDTQITDAGLEYLKGLNRLKYLNLDNTQITDSGLEHLKGLTSLKKLYLDHTQITDAGLEHLKVLNLLNYLYLSGTQVTDAGVSELKTALPRCQVVKKQETLPSSQQAAAIAEIKKFGGKVSLNKSGEATQVILQGPQITDEGLEHLEGLTSLVRLHLSDTQIKDAGLKHLKVLPSLELLYLRNTQITDVGLEHLKGLTRLETLDLRGTQITDAGLSELKAALPKCKVYADVIRPTPTVQETLSPSELADAIAEIKRLGGKVSLNESGEVIKVILFRTKITDTGLEHLKGMTSLKDLNLSGTQITDAGLEHLKGMTSLKDLSMSGTQTTDAGLEHLKGLTSLNELGLGSTQITDAGLEHLKGLINLTYIDLTDTQITGEGLVHLKGLTSLNLLGLGSTQITDAGLEQLKGMTNLASLYLDYTLITDAGLEHLKGLISLTFLDLTDTQITGEGLVHLKALTRLNVLGLNYTKITDAGLKHLEELTNLNDLGLGSTQITDAGLEHLKGLTNLKRLTLSDTQITGEGLVHLKGLTSLRNLGLSDTQITDADLEHLKRLTSLTTIWFYNTQVTDAGLARLKAALPKCHVAIK